MLYIVNKKSKLENIQKKYPSAVILDVTSTSKYPMARMLSPFYPHYNIPIPFTPIEQHTASCVEAVWQGLKVFQYHDVDITTLRNDTMQNIKRTVRKYGRPLGHRKGVYGHELLNYYEARMMIYLPTYKWVLDNIPKAHEAAMRIKEKAKNCDIVLLDYNTNEDFQDISKPISHAGLLKLYIEENYPTFEKYPFPKTTTVKKEQTNKSTTSHKNTTSPTQEPTLF